MLLNGVTAEDLKNNPDDVVKAIADALGISPEEVSIDDIMETDKGLVAVVRHPDNAEIPKDFSDKVQDNLKKSAIPELASVRVNDAGKH